MWQGGRWSIYELDEERVCRSSGGICRIGAKPVADPVRSVRGRQSERCGVRSRGDVLAGDARWGHRVYPAVPSIEKEAPINEEKNFQVFEPIRVEKKEEPKKVEEEKKEEARPRPVMPTVFSSVYVNREKEEPKKEETVSESVKPAKPTIDLPKITDLPKRAEEPKKETSTVEDDGIIFK